MLEQIFFQLGKDYQVAKPTVAEAKALAKLFPSTSSQVPVKKFSPSADCVVLDSKRKKKAATKNKSERPVTISVVMMKNYRPNVPKGKA